MSKILVSYFSASGVTKKKAESLAQEVKGDLFEIKPKQIYTDEDLNWHDSNSRSSIEIKDKNLRPEIEDITIDINSYDTIYVGFPIWWGIAPNVVKTFMDKLDLSNKKSYYILYLWRIITSTSHKRFARNISRCKHRKWEKIII